MRRLLDAPKWLCSLMQISGPTLLVLAYRNGCLNLPNTYLQLCMPTHVHIKPQCPVQILGNVQSICETVYLWYVTWSVACSVHCKLFVSARAWSRALYIGHIEWLNVEAPASSLFTQIWDKKFSINVISMAILPYPIIIKYPNAAHILFSLASILYPKYSNQVSV